MKNDPEFNIRFVKMVESYPQLYNYTLDSYSNKIEVEKAWREISETLNKTVKDCMEKWHMLRSNFNRSLREKPESGSGPNSKRMYYLSKYMQFLIPYFKSRKKNDNFDAHEEAGEISESGNSKSVSDFVAVREKRHYTEAPTLITEETGENEDCTTPSKPCTSKSVNCRNFRRKAIKRKTNKADAFETAFISFIKSKKKCKNTEENSADMEFLKSLLPDIAKLSDTDKIEFKISVLSSLKKLLPGSRPL